MTTIDQDEDFATVQNHIWHGTKPTVGRAALDRIQTRLTRALDDNVILSRRVQELEASATVQHAEDLEARVTEALEMAERITKTLGAG